mmetsp:Transcript_25225/g.90072  ORF Transcript_25225/g.90072 Transcript_25225/m.90072 type:complete len:208 (-) Transcript_25225:11-634(-)
MPPIVREVELAEALRLGVDVVEAARREGRDVADGGFVELADVAVLGLGAALRPALRRAVGPAHRRSRGVDAAAARGRQERAGRLAPPRSELRALCRHAKRQVAEAKVGNVRFDELGLELGDADAADAAAGAAGAALELRRRGAELCVDIRVELLQAGKVRARRRRSHGLRRRAVRDDAARKGGGAAQPRHPARRDVTSLQDGSPIKQ